MILRRDERLFTRFFSSRVNYGDIKIGDTIESICLVETPKGMCNYYKVTNLGSHKVHYMYTAEVSVIDKFLSRC